METDPVRLAILNSMYPNNYAFYATTTWTRAMAGYLPPGALVAGAMPPDMTHGPRIPSPGTYSMPLSLVTKDTHRRLSSDLEKSPFSSPSPSSPSRDQPSPPQEPFDVPKPAQTLTKFTIDEILSRKDSPRQERLPIQIAPQYLDAESGHDAAVLGGGSPGAEDRSLEDSGPRYSWLQCTRYKPPKLPRVKRKDGVKKRKLGRNPRVPFTQHQVSTLERKFQRTHYLSSVDVAELSAALNLTETRVKIWFQNRRARERRDRESRQAPPGDSMSSQPQTSLSPTVTSSRIMAAPSASGAMAAGMRAFTNWPLPVPPTPTALAHFSHALQRGSSAFTPVSFPTF